MVAVTIEKVARAAAAALAHTPWRLERLDTTGRGRAFFTDDGKARLIFEFASWYPPGAHHLDDEPSIFLQYEEDGVPRVGVPYLSGDALPNLRWRASDDDIERATHAVVRDFEINFLAGAGERRTLYNRVLDRSLEAIGFVDGALFSAIKRALREDSATSVTWAERKLSILRQRIVTGRSVFTFDPSLQRPRLISTVDDFDAYVVAAFGAMTR